MSACIVWVANYSRSMWGGDSRNVAQEVLLKKILCAIFVNRLNYLGISVYCGS